MVNIKYIENKYFNKTGEKSGTLIIFQKPDGICDELCNVISERIDNLIDETETNISISAVHEVMKDFEFVETIEKNIFIYKGHGNILFSYGLYPLSTGNAIELFDSEDKKIATIAIQENKKSKWPWGAFLLLAIFIVVHFVNSKLERDRAETNERLYNKDRATIDSLKSDYYAAIKGNKTYADYLSPDESQNINRCLTRLDSEAKSMLKSVEEDGNYMPIPINTDSIRNEIKKMVRDAQKDKQRTEENIRKEENVKAYNNNISTANKLLDYLQSQKEQNKVYEKFLSAKSLDEIETELLGLKQKMEMHLSEAQSQGFYVQVPIDNASFISSIDNIFKRAKENFTANQKKIQEREKKQRKAKQRKIEKQQGQKDSERKHPSITKTGYKPKAVNKTKYENAFNALIRKADGDYKKYFYDKKDIAAARRAIRNYQSALNIMYQSSVEKRMKILQNELK